MSMLGRWDSWYAGLPAEPSAFRYGDTITYEMAAEFLSDCPIVEDWGCGAGGFKRYCKTQYIGVDGSATPFSDVVADLCTYRSSADGVLLRHVLDHNYRWMDVLENALSTATKKVCLVLFTPPALVTGEIAHNRQHGVDVPDIAFRPQDLERCFRDKSWSCHTLHTATGYGMETLYKIWI